LDTNVIGQAPRRHTSRTRLILLAVGIAFVILVAWRLHGNKGGSGAGHEPAQGPIRVDTARVQRRDVPIYLEGLGTVQAFYTVTVTARVDGEIEKIGFTEGETLEKGALIAQIDPRPYKAALEQAVAAKAKDEATLQSAKADLERYVELAPQDLTSKQTLDAQRALVAGLDAQIKGDQATIDNARTQLDYTTITAPFEARTGIRLVDPGNIVHAADTRGIVMLTQVRPISFIFTLPEDELPAVSAALATGQVPVTALSRDDTTELDRGTLALIDNQIDQTTGSARLKATFPNDKGQLWPGEFLNGRILVRTAHNAVTIPSAAVQRGPAGVFTYVVKPNSTVEMRPLQIGAESSAMTVVTRGLDDGETVVTSNQYRLQPGAAIRANSAAAPAVRTAAAAAGSTALSGGAQ
jgi:membrane fusion protein, multidrug efflux system